MLTTLAIQNNKSLLKLVMPLGNLNVITGPNGSGKSNLCRALRLLAERRRKAASPDAIAREGGLQSTLWAGPEKISEGMRKCTVPIQGVQRKEAVRLRLGYSSKELSYAIALGMPPPPPPSAPKVYCIKETIRGWCFYDHFRTDREAPERQPQLGTRTPVLHHDGRDSYRSRLTGAPCGYGLFLPGPGQGSSSLIIICKVFRSAAL